VLVETPLPPEILKVQKFGRIARACCLVLMALVLIGTILLAIAGARNIPVNMGPYTVPGNQLGPVPKAYLLVCFAVVLVIVLKGLFHLYSLFNNFAHGGIYTAPNVRHIRQLGLLAMAWAVLDILMPVGSMLLLQAGFVDNAVAGTMRPQLIFGTSNLPSFITAALILLASWIMEVGRKTQDEAEHMRRESELVV
jgi:hypothetical protein